MNKTRIVSVVLGLALVAAACGNGGDGALSAGAGGAAGNESTQNGANDPFGQADWILAQAVVDGSELALLDPYPVTLQRTGADVDGNAACNSYFGTIIDGDLLFEGFGVTEMGCEPAPMTLEFEYLDALARVTTAEGSQGSLTLSGDGIELRFEPIAPTPDVDLVGPTWVLDTLLQGDAASSTINGTNATLSFAASTISGTDGCNRFQGDYELNDETLEVGLLSLTARGCDEDVTRQAQHVGEVLAAGPTIEIERDRLTLSAPGALGMVYRASQE